MQAVVAAGFVMQKQRGRLALTGGVALGGELREFGRKARFVAQRLHPAIGDGGQGWISVLAQAADDLRQRVIEVLIVAYAEAVAGHLDAAAE